MRAAIPPRRFFVSGQPVEYWEHPDVPFGWSREDLDGYMKQRDWVLLFNAIFLAAPRREMHRAS